MTDTSTTGTVPIAVYIGRAIIVLAVWAFTLVQAPLLISAASTLAVIMGFALLLIAALASFKVGYQGWLDRFLTKVASGVGIIPKGTLVALIAVMALTACERVPAGNVGVKVYLLGGDKGVDTEELSPGRYWIGMNEELHIFPTFAQNYVWTQDENEGSENDESITFQSIEGMNIGADVGITYRVDATMVSGLFQRYRLGVEEITDVHLRNAVRTALVNEASTMKVRSIYGSGKAGMLLRATKTVTDQFAPLGIIVEKVYWIGGFRLPDSVVASINSEIRATAEARQRENEVAEAIAAAEKVRKIAAGDADAILLVATAQAEANRLLAESITPEVTAYIATEKWDGILPTFVSGGGGAIPMIQLPTPDISAARAAVEVEATTIDPTGTNNLPD
jgi:regulator of protease activity HflC (stomatin/prohibitin superfamily)